MNLFGIVASITILIASALIIEGLKCAIDEQNPLPWWGLALLLLAALVIVGAVFQ